MRQRKRLVFHIQRQMHEPISGCRVTPRAKRAWPRTAAQRRGSSAERSGSANTKRAEAHRTLRSGVATQCNTQRSSPETPSTRRTGHCTAIGSDPGRVMLRRNPGKVQSGSKPLPTRRDARLNSPARPAKAAGQKNQVGGALSNPPCRSPSVQAPRAARARDRAARYCTLQQPFLLLP